MTVRRSSTKLLDATRHSPSPLSQPASNVRPLSLALLHAAHMPPCSSSTSSETSSLRMHVIGVQHLDASVRGRCLAGGQC